MRINQPIKLKIHDKLPEYTMYLFKNEDPDRPGEWNITCLELYGPSDQKSIQALKVPYLDIGGPISFTQSSLGERLAKADFNGDGYEDLCISNEITAKNIYHACFLWNPKKHNLEHHKELSAIPNMWMDETSKSIRSHTNDGHAGLLYTDETYAFKNGRLILFEQTRQTCLDDFQTYKKTTKKRVNDSLKVVETKVMSREQAIKGIESD